MFDTHCHLNFGAFDGIIDEVVKRAQSVGVSQIVIPGTDVPTSEKAVKIAEKYEGIYVAVGIHPHHVFELFEARERNFFAPVGTLPAGNGESQVAKNLIPSPVIPAPIRGQAPAGIQSNLIQIENLLKHPKVVAIGEIGIDRHYYIKTKHKDYEVNEEFIELQREFFLEQIKLAHKYKKALIIHNREAKKDVLEILSNSELRITNYSSVFHCCEPDPELLQFAKDHRMFIGVDGDITYYKEKQEWIKTVPLEMLVLETDSPFLNPEPLRKTEGGTKNEPKNILLIAEFVAKLKRVTVDEVSKRTRENANILFKVSP